MSDDPLPDHPEVRMPPPLLHLGGLLIGYGLDQALGWTLPALPGREALAAALALAGVALVLAALLQLAAHRTTAMPHRRMDSARRRQRPTTRKTLTRLTTRQTLTMRCE